MTLHELRARQFELEKQVEELRRAQAELDADRARMFDLYDLAPVGYLTLSEPGLILQANFTASTLLGVGRGELVEQPFSRFIVREDRDINDRFHKQLVETGAPQAYDLRMLRGASEPFWACLAATAGQDADGVPTYRVVLSDLTERMRVAEALRVSRERPQSILDNTSLLVYAKDIDGRLTFINRRCESLFGRPRQQLLGKTSHDLMGQEDADAHRANDLAVTAQRMPVTIEEANDEADGRHTYLSTKFPLFSAAGELEGICGISADITERKRAEEALRESERALTEAQQIARIGSWAYDIARDKPSWSRQMFDLFGREPSLGEPSWQEHRSSIHPADWEILNASVMAAATAGTPYSVEFRVLHPTRGLRWYWTIGSPECEVAGKVVKLKGTVQDITERKRAEEEKARLEAHLQRAQKMESVGRLAGGVAHGFNNMLGVILGNAELALTGLDPGQPLYDDLMEIRAAASRSADLTRQLLAFARKQTVAPTVLDLNETVGATLTMLRRLIGENIDLLWRPAENLWRTKVDPSQIDQILANLCVNARDAIAGVGTFTIETENTTFDDAYCANHLGHLPGEYVRLAASDDGCGMDKETLSHLFEPFFTTKAMGKGTGLGLATVYGIVKQNFGFINVYSEPDMGTTFTIYLPRHVVETELVRTKGAVDPANRGHETILLVEDDPAVLKMAMRLLAGLGYTVLPARSPGEAIRVAGERAAEIHLLMTDVVMPEMNGRDLATKLLALYPHFKRLFTSGHTADVIAHHGVLDEGVPFLQKPFSVHDLAAKVREVLDQS